jgi:hypothetical protein
MATGRVEQLPARQKKVTGRKSYLYPRLEIYTRIHTRWISVDIGFIQLSDEHIKGKLDHMSN